MSKEGAPTGQILLIRAMNATRPTYFPSYMGLRIVGSQMPADNTGYLERMIVRRLRSGDSWRYRPFDLYKGTTGKHGEQPEHVYRKCIAPSPSTAIAESLVLALLATDPIFKVPDRVFSYRWPKTPYSGGNYEFFAQGYIQRNVEIGAALSEGKVAVVTDIKGFYPSVSVDQAEDALRGRLTQSNSQLRNNAESIMGFYRGLLEAGGQGIPIGPASGHVLGHLILENVDKELTDQFGTSYFRYVDDIIVVANEADRRSVEKTVDACLRRYGFEPNADKSVALPAQAWEHNLVRSDTNSTDTFRAFTSDLTVYLAFHPDRAEDIKKAFAASGLSIPVGKLLAISRYSRFRYFLRRRKAPEGLGHALSLWLSDNSALLKRALELKASYERALALLLDEPHEKEPSLRRWQVQRIRRVVNIMFYLREFGEWREATSSMEEFPELVEQHALADALCTGRANPVLPFYGRGPSAFAELWGEYGNGVVALDWTKDGLTSAELESVITLQLHGTLTQVEPNMDGEHPHARLMRMASYDRPQTRSSPDLSFEDELESLRLSVSNDELSALGRTRYSLTESTALDALTLMSSDYRS
ncbi:MAG: RNA-directed DNA polymerase [Betaproteobacteria bacterium]|nr:RNA-directed DNA polymerase [Betaproteobacteria bacterium]